MKTIESLPPTKIVLFDTRRERDEYIRANPKWRDVCKAYVSTEGPYQIARILAEYPNALDARTAQAVQAIAEDDRRRAYRRGIIANQKAKCLAIETKLRQEADKAEAEERQLERVRAEWREFHKSVEGL